MRCGDRSRNENCDGTCVSFSVSSDKLFVLQLAVWALRGVSSVAYANNPLSGVLILAALFWESRWQCLLGTLGVLTSTLTAIVLGQDRWCSLQWLHICMHVYEFLTLLCNKFKLRFNSDAPRKVLRIFCQSKQWLTSEHPFSCYKSRKCLLKVKT